MSEECVCEVCRLAVTAQDRNFLLTGRQWAIEQDSALAVSPAQVIGRNIRFHRKRQRLTQARLAWKSDMGEQSIRNLEAAKHSPRITTLLALARALDCSYLDLLLDVE